MFSATKLQVATYLLGVCPFSIAFLVFLNSSVSFVITDLIGQDKETVAQWELGDLKPFDERPVSDRGFVVPLTLAPKTNYTTCCPPLAIAIDTTLAANTMIIN